MRTKLFSVATLALFLLCLVVVFRIWGQSDDVGHAIALAFVLGFGCAAAWGISNLVGTTR